MPGDEVRAIDWNVTARGAAVHQEVREEREMTLIAGGRERVWELRFGRSKANASSPPNWRACSRSPPSVTVTRLAWCSSATAWSVSFRRAKGGGHVLLRIVRDVLSFEPVGRGTDLAHALKFANEVSDRRGIVFLLSDFQTPNRSIDATADLRLALRQVNRRHDLVALPIEDPRERVLPELGIIAIEDAETGEMVEIDTPTRRCAKASEKSRSSARNNSRRFSTAKRSIRSVSPPIGLTWPI